ncbi:MAG: sigma 54-interacting transcriptional regulator [Byssovorax sp.]
MEPGFLDEAQRERDLYRKLLDLGHQTEIEPFLDEALALIVELAGAQRGYLELLDDRGPSSRPATPFSIARGCSDVEVAEIRAAFSSGVIAEALATGKTIIAASALLDPRFRDRGSVRRNKIEAVLCAPIGGTSRPLGVVYLQGRQSHGQEERGPFSEKNRVDAERFARDLLPFVDRLLYERRARDATDPTRPFRTTLRTEGLIGRSEALAKVLRLVTLVAPLDISVLITGASGTGKTQIARLIHDSSPRAQHPFVEVNCSTLPAALLENELFGSMPGAHSTATRRVEGKVAAAEGGTLFLDEVAELAMGAQAKLLQLLQSMEYFPLGSSRAVRANVRVIAATNTDLKAAMARGEFREDLFYRLEVLPMRMPSLAERSGDVIDLAVFFCARAVEALKLPELTMSPGALLAAEAAAWPGNIRQLAHAVQAAAIYAAAEGMMQIERRHLFPEADADSARSETKRLTWQAATWQFQKGYLEKTLGEMSWNVSEVARVLDLARSHVYNLIKAFGLERKR